MKVQNEMKSLRKQDIRNIRIFKIAYLNGSFLSQSLVVRGAPTIQTREKSVTRNITKILRQGMSQSLQNRTQASA